MQLVNFRIILEDEDKLIPPDGIYAVTIIDDEGKYNGRCFISGSREAMGKTGIEFQPEGDVSCMSKITTLLFHEKLNA